MSTQTPEIFTGSFTQQEPIPEEGIAAAVAVMQSGRLHRYNVKDGEVGEVGEVGEPAAHDRELTSWTS